MHQQQPPRPPPPQEPDPDRAGRVAVIVLGSVFAAAVVVSVVLWLR
ncbi:hypothetical protein QOM21_27145 [Streptomyces sp. Pv4-95]